MKKVYATCSFKDRNFPKPCTRVHCSSTDHLIGGIHNRSQNLAGAVKRTNYVNCHQRSQLFNL